MYSNNEIYIDRLIDKKELRSLVPYSPSHIARLEKTGSFPRRIQLGPCRVAWSQYAVVEWIETKKGNDPSKKRGGV
jgi:prophage regulatory protein